MEDLRLTEAQREESFCFMTIMMPLKANYADIWEHCYPIELSTMTEMFYIHVVQYDSPWNEVRRLNFLFNLI